MKTKVLAVALLASAALIVPVQAGGHNGGGGGGGSFGGGAGRGGARGGAGPSVSSMPGRSFGGGGSLRSMPMRSFGGNRTIYSGQRFSPMGMHSAAFRQPYIHPYRGGPIGTPRFTPGNINRGNGVTRFSNERTGAGQIRNRNSLPSNWRDHVVAQHSGNWHRDWDRGRDHWWHGHRCRFVNGSWFIFDTGFYPWWPYWYPYDYYGYGYPDGYDQGYYGSDAYQGEEYYGQNGDPQSDQNNGSTVAVVQERLEREGYYHGQIDGVFGPETRAAIAQFQSNHGLRVTGALTSETLAALGLQQLASY
jgi:Putative peptidoglycan binding domain